MTLKELGNTPFHFSVLESAFPNNSALSAKAQRLEEAGELIRLKRGMYVVAPGESGVRLNEFLIANHLHGPSYVSLQTALRYYGLIPESVAETISVTTGHAKRFVNDVGIFSYLHCPAAYFHVGIRSMVEDNAAFLIASPEKALSDLITFTPHLNLRYRGEVKTWLEEDMRIDLEALRDFDVDTLRQCLASGRKKRMIVQLIKIIEDERNV